MQPLQPFRQSAGLCGPASLKILLGHYGKHYTEAELTAMCEATAEHGTDHAGMVKAIDTLSEEPIIKQNATLDDLRFYVADGVPIVVGWWSTDEDHYSVVYDIDDEDIYLMDPELDQGTRTMPLAEFEKVWYDIDGPKNERVDKWMMVVPSLKR